MKESLFGHLPEQPKPEKFELDLGQFEETLLQLSEASDFQYVLHKDRVPLIIARGKGLTIRYELDTKTGQIIYSDHTDVMEASNGHPTETTPRMLDTSDLIERAKSELVAAMEDTVDPPVIEN